MKKIILISTLLSIVACSTTKTIQCYLLSDAIPVSSKVVKANKDIKLGSKFLISFNPLLLPVKLIYSSRTGFSIAHSEREEIITPIGSVGIQYSFGTQSVKEINGHKITSGDYLVGIADHNKNKIELFKLEGFNRLKVMTVGKTVIDAQSGYVEIDVTNSTVEELTFIDNSKISIVNTTDKVQTFSLNTIDNTGLENEIECEVPPFSYRYFPRYKLSKTLGDQLNTEMAFEVKNNDVNNNSSTAISKKVAYGEVFQIVYDQSKTGVTLEKKR